MVRITRQTNIFNLIRNVSSTVEDFKKLYELAPEKFKQLEPGERDIIAVATISSRDDLVIYFSSLENPTVANKILELLERPANKLREFLEDKDLKTLTEDEQIKVVEVLFNAERENYNIYDKLIILLDKGIDINIILKDGSSFIPEYYTYDNVKFKHLIKEYNFDLNKKTVNGFTLLCLVLLDQQYDAVKILIENGANVNELTHGLGYLGYIYSRVSFANKDKYYKLFLENGINPNQPLQLNHTYTLLVMAIHNKNRELFDLLLEKGANPNIILQPRNITPLAIAAAANDIYFMRKLIEKEADLNYFIADPPQPLLLSCIVRKNKIDIIKLVIDSGVNKDATFRPPGSNEDLTAYKYALEKYDSDKGYYGAVIELLGEELPKEKMWKGFSRSDIEKFDIFFEKPYDWSTCPICLEYIERAAGCMYMSHDCATTGHYYHKDLYDDFMYSYGTRKVEWCTICGRVTENHKHFKLSQAQEPSKEKAPLKPEIQEQLDRGDNIAFYDNANCIGFGGGGLEEKAARFRRLREYALELQEDVDKRAEEEVMKELVEEVWNAPSVRNRKIKKILEDKKWNVNVKNFPENKKNTRNNNDANAANVPFNGRKPTIVEEDCIIFGEDEDTNTRETNPKFRFHHENVGGMNHEGIYICQKDLAKSIEIKNSEFGLEDFGKCWFSPCKGILHPEELNGIIPEVLYEDYRKKFNKKMARRGGGRTRKIKKQKQRGGNVKSMLHELKDGTCAPHLWTRDGKLRIQKKSNNK